MTADAVSIHLIHPEDQSRVGSIEVLTPEEKLRASRYRFPEDAVRWVAYRSALREILSQKIGVSPQDVPIVFSNFGKPVLAHPFDQLHFNLSHCPDLALVAISTVGPVGVDLESLSRARELLDCETSFCHPEEIKVLSAAGNERSLDLLRIWTAKEAVLKALGTGLSHPPESVKIHFGPTHATATSDISLAGLQDQKIQKLQDPRLSQFCAFVSTPERIKMIKIESQPVS